MTDIAAQLCAAAVLELFPEAELLYVLSSEHEFFCDFAFPFSFQKKMLPLVEERIRQIIKEKRPIKELEMVPQSAAGFLAHHGQPALAEAAEMSEESLLSLFQMGNFVCLSSAFPFSHTGECGAMRLINFSLEGEGRVRLFGTSAESEAALKEVLKKKRGRGADHLKIGKELSLFFCEEGRVVWHPSGEILTHQLKELRREVFGQEKFHLIGADCRSSPELVALMKSYAQTHSLSRLAWQGAMEEKRGEGRGLFGNSSFSTDRFYLICDKEQVLENLISSLQLIVKILKILRFEFKVALCTSSSVSTWREGEKLLQKALRSCGCNFEVEKNFTHLLGPRVEMRVCDALGKEWMHSFVELDGNRVTGSLVYSVERTVALLLESGEDELPLKVAPCQVALFGVEETDQSEVERVKKVLRAANVRAEVDEETDEMRKRLHRARCCRVPLLGIIGEKERKKGKIALGKVEMNLSQLIQMVQEKCSFENQ